jgi:hypothetical protein
MCQCAVHAFTIKTSRSSLCAHPWWKNRLTNAGTFVGPGVALMVAYLFYGPLFTVYFLTSATSWVLWLGFALVVVPATELAKALARRGWIRGGVP